MRATTSTARCTGVGVVPERRQRPRTGAFDKDKQIGAWRTSIVAVGWSRRPTSATLTDKPFGWMTAGAFLPGSTIDAIQAEPSRRSRARPQPGQRGLRRSPRAPWPRARREASTPAICGWLRQCRVLFETASFVPPPRATRTCPRFSALISTRLVVMNSRARARLLPGPGWTRLFPSMRFVLGEPNLDDLCHDRRGDRLSAGNWIVPLPARKGISFAPSASTTASLAGKRL